MSNTLRSDELRLVSGQEAPLQPAGHDEPHQTGELGRREVAMHDRRNVAIELRGATLQYPIGPYVRGSLKAGLLGIFGGRESKPTAAFVDAITDLDLSIRTGERVGVIGSNGSGKSTFLRALAGVYPLKSGSISVVGQIGTLLDISLGFEGESTGRENIYYRGLAMGYSPKEIAKAEREIVEFAALGEFIDLPMRTYSSGMFVRLGFAVSTQFMPDVLLVDEVFGAGDAAFAEKAVRRMMRVVQAAGIMVLATHDLALVNKICTRTIWLKSGRIVRDGQPSVVIPQFQQFMAGQLDV